MTFRIWYGLDINNIKYIWLSYNCIYIYSSWITYSFLRRSNTRGPACVRGQPPLRSGGKARICQSAKRRGWEIPCKWRFTGKNICKCGFIAGKIIYKWMFIAGKIMNHRTIADDFPGHLSLLEENPPSCWHETVLSRSFHHQELGTMVT